MKVQELHDVIYILGTLSRGNTALFNVMNLESMIGSES